MWKSGIWLQQMSVGFNSHAAAMHIAPASRSPRVCGTTFLLPVEPDVCRTIACKCRQSLAGWAQASEERGA